MPACRGKRETGVCLRRKYRQIVPGVGEEPDNFSNERTESVLGQSLIQLSRIKIPVVIFLFEHNLFGKPASTIPDHAQARQHANGIVGLSTGGFRRDEISPEAEDRA
jgi:hypothetical protein